jgi:hypothetical protein
MQARVDESGERGEQDEAVTVAEQTVIWCGKCGIPYAATMTHCSLCGAPLADPSDPFAAAPQVVPSAAATSRTESQSMIEPETFVPVLPPLQSATVAPSAGLLGRIRQRPQGMSDDEVDAAAAAIIARARAEERLAGDDSLAPMTAELLPSLLPDPATEAALLQRRQRDRVWLIAGFVCCVILIVVALAISRYTSSGLLAR